MILNYMYITSESSSSSSCSPYIQFMNNMQERNIFLWPIFQLSRIPDITFVCDLCRQGFSSANCRISEMFECSPNSY